jgi:hypothetical protein
MKLDYFTSIIPIKNVKNQCEPYSYLLRIRKSDPADDYRASIQDVITTETIQFADIQSLLNFLAKKFLKDKKNGQTTATTYLESKLISPDQEREG